MSSLFTRFRDGIQHGVYRIIDPGVRLMVRLGATPNMMTTCGLLGNLVAAALIVLAAHTAVMERMMGFETSYSMLGWAGVVMLLFSIFDMVDGYMARTAHLESRFGAFYDSVLDRYCELAVLAAMAYYFMCCNEAGFMLWTLMAMVGSVMVSYVRARAEALAFECKGGLMQRPERVVVTSVALILTPLLDTIVRPHFDPVWIVAAAMILIAVLANVTAVARILHVRKQNIS